MAFWRKDKQTTRQDRKQIRRLKEYQIDPPKEERSVPPIPNKERR